MTTKKEAVLAEAAFQVESRIKETITGMKQAWVFLAEGLFVFQEKEYWRPLGYASFEEWLAGPEIDLGRRQAYYLIATYKELVVEHGATHAMLENVGISKAKTLLPALRRKKVDLVTALSDAETLASRDLTERYAALARDDGQEGGTGYDADKEPTRHQCPACGSWLRS